MQSMTLKQLRVANQVGGVSGVTLKGQDGGFLIQITTCSGFDAVLSKARSREPRRFGNPIAALSLLCGLGITLGQFDVSIWNPAEKIVNSREDARARVLRETHAAGAYAKWLAAKIQESIDDPRPSIPHDDVMARMDARIAHYKATSNKRV